MSKKMNEKESDAGKNVKRAKTEQKETKVNGSAKFENGKLQTPEKTVTDELMAMQKKKEQLKAQVPEPEPKTLAEAQKLIDALRMEITKLKTHRTAPKLEELPDEESPIKYFNFCQVQKYRDEMKYILEQVEQIPGIEIRHNAYAECYRINNKLVGELFPLKRQWSARINPGVVKRWDTADEYLEELKAQVEKVRVEVPAKAEQKPAPVKAIKSKKVESVDAIKGRIEKLTGGRNAIHLKSVTPEIEALAKDNSYKLLKSEAGGYDLIVGRIP